MQNGEQSSLAADAFGVPPPPWYRRGSTGTPKEPAAVVGLASTALAGVAVSGSHGLLRLAIAVIVLGGPPWLLASFYSELRRRRAEVVLPADGHDPPAWLPQALRPRED